MAYNVAANTTANPRFALITIADKIFMVTQDGQSATKKTLTIIKEGTGDGSVKVLMAVSTTITWNGNLGIVEYDFNTAVTLTADGNLTSDFYSWNGCDTVFENVCTIKMTESRRVAVKFNKKGDVVLTVTKTGTGDGKVTPSTGVFNWSGATGTATYSANTQVILLAEPDQVSKFIEWKGCDVPIGNQCTLTMTAAHGVTAEFKKSTGKARKDFDGDGKSDVLWQDIATGDYNGDGMNDMLWQNDSTGDVYMWTMDSTGTGYSDGTVDQGIPSDWSIY
ncbi:peptidase S8/S53 subtilisin kexin sedolisin [Candidatus Magnetobacterium bavaricum]|uniref:Peptidase S8/S53 subtilisin kexin sedolisin n=1 Tax=Candidatus Magnetobacterium bavaricum TaxID=29290 RepID=A0A0F3GJ65_9BACT|nr:peptidase S8/S53 subtilisin kexin sedolisin [Candidatus Magnetobacterium bavaricum]